MEMNNGVISKEDFLPIQDLAKHDQDRTDPLWESLKSGDDKAFETIFRRYYPALLNYGLRLNPDDEEVKDCIQIMFLNIWERRSFLGASDSIRNYLLASLRRLMLKRMKSESNFVQLASDLSTFHMELSVESKIINDQTLTENILLIQNAIGNLPDRQKEALYLRFYSDQSFPEIANVMGISTRAVYKLIYKALDALNEELTLQSKNAPFSISLLLALAFTAGETLAVKGLPFSSLLD
jgi:RNA polymerase sigma factor (sigma-70 family)